MLPDDPEGLLAKLRKHKGGADEPAPDSDGQAKPAPTAPGGKT